MYCDVKTHMIWVPLGLEEEQCGAATAGIIHAGKTLLLGADAVTSLWSASASSGGAESFYMKQKQPSAMTETLRLTKLRSLHGASSL